MKLKQILKGLTDYKVFFSLLGGILISSGFPLAGNLMWSVIDIFWYYHYKNLGDVVSQVMFAAWFIIAVWGSFYWWLIT